MVVWGAQEVVLGYSWLVIDIVARQLLVLTMMTTTMIVMICIVFDTTGITRFSHPPPLLPDNIQALPVFFVLWSWL